MNRGTVGRRIAGVLFAGSMFLVACSPSSTVEQGASVPIDGGIDASDALDASGLPSLSTPDPDTLTGTLDNGLRYLVRDNDNPGGKVELRLVVDAGSGIEDDDQVGGAHFLEHMLFNGTERFPRNELIDVLRSFGAAFGADVNASTSRDETVYTLNVPATDEAVGTALDILEDWLSAATIDPGAVESERGIVLDEWRSRDQTANGRIVEAISSFFLDGTTYEGHSPIGGREAIETITADALRRFYDDWYRPDNAAVIVVGDIDVDDIEGEIVGRFADAEARGDSPERVVIEVEPQLTSRALVVADPDVAEGFAAVTLPVSRGEGRGVEAESQRSILDGLAFDVIADRLDADALRDEAPFDRARRSSSSIVRDLDAPEISVDVDGADLGAAVTAIIDEYERVARFGITEAELDRVVAAQRSSAQRFLDGSDSRQDVSFADEYTRHVLEDEWFVTAQQEFDHVTAVLDRATPDTVAGVFADRYRDTGAHVLAVVPDAEFGDTPSLEDLVMIADEAPGRDLEDRAAGEAIGDSIIDRPDAVSPASVESLVDDPFGAVIDPLVITFENGMTVSVNSNRIVDNQVFFEARRLGGLDQVADADVADAQALGGVLADSGVADFDRVAIEQFLDDKSVSFAASIDVFTSSMGGTAAVDDLEVLFQLINLALTEPRVDRSAIDRYVDDRLPFAQDPSIDAGVAEFVALAAARYDDPRFLTPSPESLATVDAAGIERVAADRLGNADGWFLSFSGDLDIESATELAAAYLGPIPAGEPPLSDDGYVEPEPPQGAVVATAEAGGGETANVSFLMTAGATTGRLDVVRAAVAEAIIGNRLTDVIREELGDSYSPFALLDVGDGPQPNAELYISVSTAPDLVEGVSSAVLGELASLRADGPTAREFSNAVATIAEQSNFVNNAQINDEIIDSLFDPDATARFDTPFDDFLNEAFFIQTLSQDDVASALDQWTSATDYIEVRVLPSE